MLSGQNPAMILISVFLVFGLAVYFLLKKRKEDKI
jgi:LPXTG-motif cell wall-anchored protein